MTRARRSDGFEPHAEAQARERFADHAPHVDPLDCDTCRWVADELQAREYAPQLTEPDELAEAEAAERLFPEVREHQLARVRHELSRDTCPWVRGEGDCTCTPEPGVTQSPPWVPHGEADKFGRMKGRDARRIHEANRAEEHRLIELLNA